MFRRTLRFLKHAFFVPLDHVLTPSHLLDLCVLFLHRAKNPVQYIHFIWPFLPHYIPNWLCNRVLDNLKDYAVRALVNAVDHLGTVAYKLTELLEQQTSDLSSTELKITCLNQVWSLQIFVRRSSP